MARAEANPLRILDSKRDDWQEMIETAPQIGDYLTDAAATDFETVQAGLRALGIAFELAPRLVRGFDYYTGTTFEFQSDALDSAQNAIGGGGRYDGLVEQMGGKPTPGIGFGIGIERIAARVRRAKASFAAPASSGLDVFVIDTVGGLGGAHALLDGAAGRGFVRGSCVRQPIDEEAMGRCRSGGGALGRDARTARARRRTGRGEGPRDGRAGRSAARRRCGLVAT